VNAVQVDAVDRSVAIVVGTKNSARTLLAFLESARFQTVAAAEIIVVDNDSTDGTRAIAEQQADIVLLAGPERSAQRNAGVRIAKSRFVLVLDSDMVLEPTVLESCLAVIGGAPAVIIPEVSFGSGYWAACKSLERSFYQSDRLTAAARFFRRDDFLRVGGYDENLTGPEDWDLSIRLCGAAAPAIASTIIRHDEGHQRLSNLFRKKYYYGVGLRRFLRKHGVEALKRCSPARGSLISNLPTLLRYPHLGVGVVIMKFVELLGALAGMARRQRQPETAVYKAL
jgi:glycosyltransferase involved in cell wall biosynthesis